MAPIQLLGLSLLVRRRNPHRGILGFAKPSNDYLIGLIRFRSQPLTSGTPLDSRGIETLTL